MQAVASTKNHQCPRFETDDLHIVTPTIQDFAHARVVLVSCGSEIRHAFEVTSFGWLAQHQSDGEVGIVEMPVVSGALRHDGETVFLIGIIERV